MSMLLAEGEVVTTIPDFLSTLTEILTKVIAWMGQMLTFITDNPIILVPMLMFFVAGGVIGLIMRVLRG